MKKHPLIISKETIENVTTVVIKNTNHLKNNSATKLSHVFNFLPSGFVLKGETGLGATTLELYSERNSIIVEPIKITASSKAAEYTAKNYKKNLRALYVGSPTSNHSDKLRNKDIEEYLNDDSIKYKKIIVVADSLYRVIKYLDNTMFHNYFFMIDEIDSFQLDSSFRTSMETCIDIYKQFPSSKRAIVSATSIEFSDPLLATEHLTKIVYEFPVFRNIDVYFIPMRINNHSVKIIQNILNKADEKDKLMVAYNSVTGCYDLAQALIKQGVIEQTDIKILCSNSNKEKLNDFYAELASDSLPAKLNFFTSAYFTGFDLSERYHLVSISSNKNPIHSLSDKRFKQIAGRCRHPEGLLSESIVYDVAPKNDTEKEYNKEDLLSAAETEILALKYLEENFKHHELLKHSTNKIKNLIVENTTSYGHRFVRMKDHNPEISYLNIDACLEAVRVRKRLYVLNDTLPKLLTEHGHKVNIKRVKGEIEIVKSDIETQSRSNQIDRIIGLLKLFQQSNFDFSLIHKPDPPLTPLEGNVLRKYLELYPYIDSDELLVLMEENGKDRDSRALNNLFLSAYFLTLHPDVLYKRLVSFHLPIQSSFTANELLDKWNHILVEGGFVSRRIKTTTKAVRLTKLHYKVQKKKSNEVRHYIKDINPYALELMKYRNYLQSDREKEEFYEFMEN